MQPGMLCVSQLRGGFSHFSLPDCNGLPSNNQTWQWTFPRLPGMIFPYFPMKKASLWGISQPHPATRLCLVYIDRIVKLHPDFTICSLNIHRRCLMGHTTRRTTCLYWSYTGHVCHHVNIKQSCQLSQY